MDAMANPKTFVNEGASAHPRTTQAAVQPDGPGLINILLAVRRARLGKATVKRRVVSGATRKAVLLALATYADGTGGSIYPPLSMIAAEAEVNERAAQLAVQSLVADKVLIVVTPSTPRTATSYKLDLDRLAALTPARGVPRAPLDGPKRGVRRAAEGGATHPLPFHYTLPDTPEARASARGAGFDMHTYGAQSAASEPPTDGPPEEPVAEAEPVRLVAGQLVLSESQRAYWLAPTLFAGDAIALDLALTEASGAVQPRGAHSLDVQVRRQLARIARQRRDQDRRYREARTSGSASPARPSWGAKPGHRSREAEAATEATRSPYVGRSGGGYIYGSAIEDPDEPKWYALTSPEGQAYRAYYEAEGLDSDLAKLERRGGLKLRPSAARHLLATGRPGAQSINGAASTVVARATALQRAQQREPGHA